MKKVLSLLLAMSLCFSLCACGDKSNVEDSNKDNNSTVVSNTENENNSSTVDGSKPFITEPTINEVYRFEDLGLAFSFNNEFAYIKNVGGPIFAIYYDITNIGQEPFEFYKLKKIITGECSTKVSAIFGDSIQLSGEDNFIDWTGISIEPGETIKTYYLLAVSEDEESTTGILTLKIGDNEFKFPYDTTSRIKKEEVLNIEAKTKIETNLKSGLEIETKVDRT